MFDNVVLDVAIGLIFIYVLYSLLATAIKEFIATIFSYRSRMLERGIEQMLDGKNIGYYWWDKLKNIFLWLYYLIGQRRSPDANEEIKSLQAFLGKSDLSNPEIRKPDGTYQFYYRRVKINKKSVLFTAKVTDHPLYKRKAEKSLLFKKPSYLNADSFSDILLDILSEKKSTSAGSSVLMKDIAVYVNNSLGNNPELKKILTIFMEQANGDLQRFKLLVENWYDETMERVSGWYKKQATWILLIIGFVLALTFNVSTIQIVDKLSNSEPLREAMVANASEYVKQHVAKEEQQEGEKAEVKNEAEKKLPDEVAKKDIVEKIDSTDKNGIIVSQVPGDSTAKVDTGFEKARRQIENIKKLYNESIKDNNSLLGLGWGDYGYKNDSLQFLRDSILFQTDKKSYCKDHSSWLSKCTEPQKPEHPGFWGKIFYVLGQGLFSWKNLIGFIITAFAISLGAPFWFDLLNKFVNLRASGKKPEKSPAIAGAKASKLNQKPDPTAKG